MTDVRTPSPTCDLCALSDDLPADLDVLVEGGWRVFVHPEYLRPNCLWIVAQVHADGLWDLDPVSARALGPVLQRVAALLCESEDAARTYLVSFGESYAHFHLLLITRAEHEEEKGLALVGQHLSRGPADLAAASAKATGLRSALGPPS